MTEASIAVRAWRKAGRISTKLVRALNLDGAHPVRVPVLMYHKIGPVSHSEWWVSTEDFAAQVRALKVYGYTPVTFAELHTFRLGVRRPPRKPIILTFDDGYRDILTDVLPVLQRSETAFKVTVFIPTGRVGGDNRWDAGIDFSREPVAHHLTWDELRAVAATGLVDFQAHTVSHPKLPDLDLLEVDRELVECRQTLERELARPIRAFSYPFSLGSHVPRVRDAVRRAGYFAAVGVDDIIEPDSRDPWNIRRLSIYANTSLANLHDHAAPFFFGPTLLDDAEVPRANCRDLRITTSLGAGNAAVAKASAGARSIMIDVRGTLENAVREVRPTVELRPRGEGSGIPSVVARSPENAVRSMSAGPIAECWAASLPADWNVRDLEARFVLGDAHGCVQAFRGPWVAVGTAP